MGMMIIAAWISMIATGYFHDLRIMFLCSNNFDEECDRANEWPMDENGKTVLYCGLLIICEIIFILPEILWRDEKKCDKRAVACSIGLTGLCLLIILPIIAV